MMSEKNGNANLDEWDAEIEALEREIKGESLLTQTALPTFLFAFFGGLGAIPSAIFVTYVIHYVLKLPHITKDPENLSEFIGILNAFIILGIFESCKLCSRLYCKGKFKIRINLLNAALLGMFLALVSAFVVTLTEIYIYADVVLFSQKTLNLSISSHPILIICVFVSCLITLWTTMPSSVKSIIHVAGVLGIIED